MHKHPLNLALRFGLELAALYAVGQWAWNQGSSSAIQWLYVILSCGVFMTIWGTFNVPGDPSRSGKAPVVVSGWMRLIVELLLFTIAVWALLNSGKNVFAGIFATLLIFHYVISIGRIKWLLQR